MTSSIYLAAPLFTQAEVAFNQSLADQLTAAGYSVYLPQQQCAGSGEHMGVNLMLSNSCQHLLLATANVDSPPAKVTYFKIGADFTPKLLEVLSNLPAAQTARIP